MSRIGKLPVSLPSGVSVELLPGNVLKVKGPHGEMCQKIDPDIKLTDMGLVDVLNFRFLPLEAE